MSCCGVCFFCERELSSSSLCFLWPPYGPLIKTWSQNLAILAFRLIGACVDCQGGGDTREWFGNMWRGWNFWGAWDGVLGVAGCVAGVGFTGLRGEVEVLLNGLCLFFWCGMGLGGLGQWDGVIRWKLDWMGWVYLWIENTHGIRLVVVRFSPRTNLVYAENSGTIHVIFPNLPIRVILAILSNQRT